MFCNAPCILHFFALLPPSIRFCSFELEISKSPHLWRPRGPLFRLSHTFTSYWLQLQPPPTFSPLNNSGGTIICFLPAPFLRDLLHFLLMALEAKYKYTLFIFVRMITPECSKTFPVYLVIRMFCCNQIIIHQHPHPLPPSFLIVSPPSVRDNGELSTSNPDSILRPRCLARTAGWPVGPVSGIHVCLRPNKALT